MREHGLWFKSLERNFTHTHTHTHTHTYIYIYIYIRLNYIRILSQRKEKKKSSFSRRFWAFEELGRELFSKIIIQFVSEF